MIGSVTSSVTTTMHAFQLYLLFQMLVLSFRNDNPGIKLSTPELISRYGYPAETHTIETADGYLLSIHRIPSKKPLKNNQPAPVVYLQHGLLSSSADWVLAGPKQALGLILADLGFDVWMGNCRGNTYSRAHIRMLPSSKEFWQFSWDEMAKYDLPATTDYIINVTNQEKMIYVGHSMGTTICFALLSAYPKYNERFHVMIALAPTAYVSHISSQVQYVAPWVDQLEESYELLHINEFLAHAEIFDLLAQYLCGHGGLGRELCIQIMFSFRGFDKSQITDEILPLIVGHTPAGTSIRTGIHYTQIIHSGRFCRYDYGLPLNLVKYNSPLPPEYNLEAVQVPVALLYADDDVFVSQRDLKTLIKRLPNIIDIYKVPYKGFNHIDFVYAKDAPKLVYDRVLHVIEKFATSPNPYLVINLGNLLSSLAPQPFEGSNCYGFPYFSRRCFPHPVLPWVSFDVVNTEFSSS